MTEPKTKSRDLEVLLERIASGGIADVEQLQEQDITLLRDYFGHTEELEALLDNLRDGDAA